VEHRKIRYRLLPIRLARVVLMGSQPRASFRQVMVTWKARLHIFRDRMAWTYRVLLLRNTLNIVMVGQKAVEARI
jgi:hypothetical protein